MILHNILAVSSSINSDDTIIKVSITNITCPGFISVLDEIILATIVDPPALEFPLITRASPIPTKIPPNIALKVVSIINGLSSIISAKKSMNIDINIIVITVLIANILPRYLIAIII